MVSISLNDLDKYLDKAKSQFMSFDYKNLDREKKESWEFSKVCLNTKDNFDLVWSPLSRPPGLVSLD